jgi:hypothetical protein
MPEETSPQDLQERISLIENMLAEGRHHTESWGWTFVLWGLAYYVALAWSALKPTFWAWPVTVSAAVILTLIIASSKTHQPTTRLGRAIGSIWVALGVTMFLLFVPLGFSGRLTDLHIFFAAISAILGMANGASGLILRWKAQLACAVVWWITAAATCFGTDRQSTIIFVLAVFLCQIVFGIYGVAAKAQKSGNLIHA